MRLRTIRHRLGHSVPGLPESVRSTVTSAEQAHHSTNVFITGFSSMRPGRKLKWDPVKEKFEGEDAADDMPGRIELPPFVIRQLG